MVKAEHRKEFQRHYNNIKNWYVEQGVSSQSIQNIQDDIKNTIDVIKTNPKSFRLLKSVPFLRYAPTQKYKFIIYYIATKNIVILSDIKASKQDGLYETINNEINEILRIAGVRF